MKQVINLAIENLNAWHTLNMTSKETLHALHLEQLKVNEMLTKVDPVSKSSDLSPSLIDDVQQKILKLSDSRDEQTL